MMSEAWQIQAQGLIERVAAWARARDDVTGVALVGSYARGEARPDSDVDLVILSADPAAYLADPAWLAEFGAAAPPQREDWGAVQALRVYYADGPEVEFGLTSVAWAEIPLDPGTARVAAAGLRILYDPTGALAALQAAVARGG